MAAGIQRWSRRATTSDNGLRLVCFGHAGTGAAPFRPWAAILEPPLTVCAVRLPGRESRIRESPLTSVDDIVASVADGLTALFDRPYALYGHCFGAVLAFELAMHLQDAGRRPPTRLVVSSEPAPHRAPPPRRLVHRMTTDELTRHLRWLDGTNERVLADSALMGLLEPSIRADFQAAETYRFAARPLLATPISAYIGDHDRFFSPEQLEAWRELTSGTFWLRRLAGDHMLAGHAWLELARHLDGELRADLETERASEGA